ncbi:hypothetical protein KY320_04110, partial [Candidatus Woesearchaeota archaeon]|nr:hypothetical protein [Candidatus Woesearchaeota archaeon]
SGNYNHSMPQEALFYFNPDKVADEQWTLDHLANCDLALVYSEKDNPWVPENQAHKFYRCITPLETPDDESLVVVKETELPLRAEPSKSARKIVNIIPYGTTMRIDNSQTTNGVTWLHGIIDDGLYAGFEGWFGAMEGNSQYIITKKGISGLMSQSQSDDNQGCNVFDTIKQVCLPELASVYAAGSMEIRNTTASYAGTLNSYNLHGNRSYVGLQNWIGQDLITESADKRISAPMDGYATAGYDPNGGYYCTISGTDAYSDYFILLVHLSGACTEGYVTKEQIIGSEGPQAHVHVGVMWDDGSWSTGNATLPYSELLENKNAIIGTYTASNYVEGFSPADSILSRFIIQ